MKPPVSRYPLRPRGALELFDVSFKLYKKYFWPLLGCSLLVWITTIPLYFVFILSFSLLNAVFIVASILAFFFAFPFLYGAAGCCMQAAIEARQVGFRECVAYARERYKVLLLAQLLVLIFTIMLVSIFATLAAGFAASSNSSSSVNQALFIISFTLIAIYMFYAFYFFGVVTLMPFVSGIEFKSLQLKDCAKRCYLLSKENTRSLALLIFSHALGMIVSYVVLIAIGGVLVQLVTLQSYMQGYIGDSLFFSVIAFAVCSIMVIAVLWSPFYLLSLGTFYIDMRIRKEGFDLEYQLSHPDLN